MAARLKDVAARAGVSVRTVSNVVNGAPHVAAPTRQRVQAALDAMGYRPNMAARTLRGGRTGVIGLVVPEIDSPYFAELAATLVRAAARRGVLVHIDQTDGDPDAERAALIGDAGRRVDGMIVSPWGISPRTASQQAPDLPVVALGEQVGSDRVDRVAVDNVAAAADATRHLLAGGRTRIVALGLQPHLRNQTSQLRRTGFARAHAAVGRRPRPGLELPVDRLHRLDGWRAIATLLESRTDFDAIFAFTDQLALGAMRALRQRGVRIPQDVAIVGFDDIEDGRYASPSLSSVAPDKAQIAVTALDRLLARIQDPGLPPQDVVVGHRLVIRESSGGAASPANRPPEGP